MVEGLPVKLLRHLRAGALAVDADDAARALARCALLGPQACRLVPELEQLVTEAAPARDTARAPAVRAWHHWRRRDRRCRGRRGLRHRHGLRPPRRSRQSLSSGSDLSLHRGRRLLLLEPRPPRLLFARQRVAGRGVASIALLQQRSQLRRLLCHLSHRGCRLGPPLCVEHAEGVLLLRHCGDRRRGSAPRGRVETLEPFPLRTLLERQDPARLGIVGFARLGERGILGRLFCNLGHGNGSFAPRRSVHLREPPRLGNLPHSVCTLGLLLRFRSADARKPGLLCSRLGIRGHHGGPAARDGRPRERAWRIEEGRDAEAHHADDHPRHGDLDNKNSTRLEAHAGPRPRWGRGVGARRGRLAGGAQAHTHGQKELILIIDDLTASFLAS